MDPQKIKNMDDITVVSILMPNDIIIIICIYLLVDSKRTVSSFYYQIIQPFFSIIVFSLIFLRMVYNTIFAIIYFFWRQYPEKVKVITQMIDLLFLRNIVNIAIYTRIISIKNELVSYKKKLINFSILEQSKSKIKEPPGRKSKANSNVRKHGFINYKYFIIQFACLFILFICCFIPSKNSFIYSFFDKVCPKRLEEPDLNFITNQNDNSSVVVGGIIILLYNNLTYFFGVVPLYKIYTLQIKEDNFYLTTEFLTLMTINFVENNLGYLLGLLIPLPHKQYVYFILQYSESFYCLCKIVALQLIYVKRKNFNIKNGLTSDKAKFEEFILNNNCFQIFKNYISNKQENLNYLAFYLDYIDFISYADKNKLPNETTKIFKKYKPNEEDDKLDKSLKHDEELIDKAKEIFQNYFKGVNQGDSMLSSSNPYMSSLGSRNFSSQLEMDLSTNYLSIAFPPDIIEEVISVAKLSFIVDKLESIYDEAYKWIVVQLNSLYEEFKRDKKEQKKIQTILFFAEYFNGDFFEQMTDEEKLAIKNPIVERILPSSFGNVSY